MINASYTYDSNDRPSTDGYDANGNTISSGGVSSGYDFENRMTTNGTTTIVYDGDGNRVSETAGGTTTQYLVDTVNPLLAGAPTHPSEFLLSRAFGPQT
jgi:YD repeat-containing protein